MRAFAAFVQDLRWISPASRAVACILAVVVVLLCAAPGAVPLVRDFDNLGADMRAVASSRKVDQDDRIVLLVYTDETLRTTGKILPLDRAILARALQGLQALKPKAIGIDLLIDSPSDDDEALKGALGAMRVPTIVGHASSKSDSAGVTFEQQQFIDRLIAGARNPVVRPGALNLKLDDDLSVRSWPRRRPFEQPMLSQALVKATTSRSQAQLDDFAGPIRFKISADRDRPVFSALPIEVFAEPDLLEVLGDQVNGKYVLIGGDIRDYDRYVVPIGGKGDRYERMPGIEIQANMLAQLLDRDEIAVFPPWARGATAALALLLGLFAATALRSRWVLAATGAGVIASLTALNWLLAVQFGVSAGVNWGGWVIAFLSGALLAVAVSRAARWERGLTATKALERYLPGDVARAIVSQPDRLGLNGEMRKVFVLFTDLEGFTSLCQHESPADVAEFLNDYLERMSQVILAHGGTIDKFVGDAVVSFWGAPIARENDGSQAVAAAIALRAAGDGYRGRTLPGGSVVGRTRIGLHYGDAIVGNFGGDGRIQYTALGDTMNVAARLESANKTLKTSILASGELVAAVPDLAFRRMGRVFVRGRSTPLEIFEPATGISTSDLQRLNGFYEAALGGDGEALAALAGWAEAHPADIAMAMLVTRLQSGEMDEPTAL